jgi:hypothetical protein
MTTVMDCVDLALVEIDRLRKFLKKKTTAQVRSGDERSITKATALAWFNAHRTILSILDASANFQTADARYKQLLEASSRATSRTMYNGLLKALREALIALRSESASKTAPSTATSDHPPSFAPLIPDPQMQGILAERWCECVKCISAGAPLSATVMMGGLLEALLLGRVNRETTKAPTFQAKSAPKDKNGQPKPLTDWTLKNYIDVAHELGWISVSAKDIGEVLRDYRNYIHPFKQLSHSINLTNDDALLLWEVSKAVTRQVISSAGPPA